MSKVVSFEEDNLIYNRFDLIYGNDYVKMKMEDQDYIYNISVHVDQEKAMLNIWGKNLPKHVFEQTIENVFNKYANIRYIEVTQGVNDYTGCLCRCKDIRIAMPETIDELLQRLKSKHRYNLNRQIHMLEQQYGPLFIETYGIDIPQEYVNLYFQWKRESHGTDYGMSPKKYLHEYHVTDAMLMKAGERPVGIIFYCMVEDTAYLENLSFDSEFAEYSPGYITYVLSLEKLIAKKCRLLFLGGGDYEYKRRFGAEERLVYSGSIYRKDIFDEVNRFFDIQEIRVFAIYGLGTGGEEFLHIRNHIKVELAYGIDRQEKKLDMLQTYTPMETLPEVDAVLITLKKHNEEIELFLKQRFTKVFYWEDMAKRGIFQEL